MDKSLVEKAKKGDVEAFSELYNGVYKELYKFAVYLLNSESEAEDIVSETVIDAFEGIKKLKDESLFKSWIFKIMINKCKRNIKKRKKKVVNIEDTILQAPEVYYDENYDLKQAFSSLKQDEKMILSLAVVSGYKSCEISEILGMNHNTIRSKQSRALNKLREILDYK